MRNKVFALLLLCSTLAFTQLAFGQRDKVYHTTAGFGITIGVSSFTHRPTLGLVAGVGAGVAKEMWDSTRRGHDASARDALATAAGSGAAFVLWKYAIARKRPTIAAAPQPLPAPAATDVRPANASPAKATATAGGGR